MTLETKTGLEICDTIEKEGAKEELWVSLTRLRKLRINEARAYQKLINHRRNCLKWGNSFCLDCFGGGLTKFTTSLLNEVLKVD